MNEHLRISRRGFLRGTIVAAVGAGSFPYFVPSSALGKAGTVAAVHCQAGDMIDEGIELLVLDTETP